jgi:hypothetical protein
MGLLEKAAELCAEQEALVQKSESVAKEIKQMMQSMRAAPTADSPKDGGQARASGLRRNRQVSGEQPQEEMTSVKRQKCVDMVSKLHRGSDALRRASLDLSEALIGPGITFSLDEMMYEVIGVADNNEEWNCKSIHGRSQKIITRTAKEINESLNADL